MRLNVEATMTFREYINDNPDVYDNIVSYRWNTASNQWESYPVPETTKSIIMDWFQYRTVCDDEKFGTFFARKMNICALRFANLMRIEMSSFDPLVSEYTEMELNEIQNRTSSGTEKSNRTGNDTTSGENTSVRTPDLKYNDTNVDTTKDNTSRTSEITGRINDEGNSVTNDTRNTSVESKEAAMQKNAPQSISYMGASAGKIPDLDWQYATGQNQTENDSNENMTDRVEVDDTRTSNNNQNTTETGSNSGEKNFTSNRSETGTDSSSGTSSSKTERTENAENSKVNTENADGRKREIRTGRGGLTPQEAFRTAVTYLKSSSAFEWLKSELEECFLSIYDV